MDAQQTIQGIIDGFNANGSTSCNLQCQKRGVHVFGVLGFTKLKSQVSGHIRTLASQIIALDVNALKQFDQVSPTDVARTRINAISCKLLRDANQLLRQALRFPNSL